MKSLLLLEVELMETKKIENINPRKKESLLLLEVELMETLKEVLYCQ